MNGPLFFLCWDHQSVCLRLSRSSSFESVCLWFVPPCAVPQGLHAVVEGEKGSLLGCLRSGYSWGRMYQMSPSESRIHGRSYGGSHQRRWSRLLSSHSRFNVYFKVMPQTHHLATSPLLYYTPATFPVTSCLFFQAHHISRPSSLSTPHQPVISGKPL